MNINWKIVGLHLLFLVSFIAISIAYFHPVLQDKTIYQVDIVQHRGMAQHQIEHIEKYGEQPYWIDNAFGGMPSYQIGANYPNHFIKDFDRLLRFLPRPADYLFLYFIGFYILLLILRVKPLLSFVGALIFGFSTYLIIIIGVGHNSKAHAIAYMPLVLGGVLLCLKHKYIKGFLLLSVAVGLQFAANHFQMTYYLTMVCLVIGIVYLIDAIKNNNLNKFVKAVGVAIIAALLGLSLNAPNILATKQYTQFSTRGDATVTITPEGKPKPDNTALDYDYITQYSYGILESLNVLVPRLMGGANTEKLDRDSETYKELVDMGAKPLDAKRFVENAPLYWGNQPFVAAPAYIGAGVLFLFVVSLFLLKSKFKKWIISICLLALVLSWGDNFAFITKLFIDYVPLYDKFRAVSSIQVVLELCIPLAAIIGLSRFFSKNTSKEEKLKALKWGLISVGGLLVALLIVGNAFSFSGGNDSFYIQQYGARFVRALKEDRKAIFFSDVLRSLFICAAVGLPLWLYLRNKLKQHLAIIIIGVVCLGDLLFININYVNENNFVPKIEMKRPFALTEVDKEIKKDTSHYRVLDLADDAFNSSRASFYHKSIGGYFAAKPQRIQDLISFHISRINYEVLNMMNIKYFILENEGNVITQVNPEANGNAWFINKIKVVKDDNEAIMALNDINTKTTAIFNSSFDKTEFSQLTDFEFKKDSTAFIDLVSYKMNELVYESSNPNEGFAVFSEVYYPYGWNAYIDDEPVDHYLVNYTLRGLNIPKGEHIIKFKFEPEVIKTGSYISLAGHVVFVIILLLGGLKLYKESKAEKANA